MTKPEIDWDAHIDRLTKAKDRLGDEELGLLLCDLHGWVFMYSAFEQKQLRIGYGAPPETGMHHWHSLRDRCPDVDLTAVDQLVLEVLPGWARCSKRGSARERDYRVGAWASLSPDDATGRQHMSEHPTSEPLAILTALCRAKKAEAET